MLGIEDNFVSVADLADMSVGPSLSEEGRMFPGGPTYTDLTASSYQQNSLYTSRSQGSYNSAPCGSSQHPDPYQHHVKHQQQHHPSQHQQPFYPHQQDAQHYPQHHNGHSRLAQQEQQYSQQHHDGHSHSPPAQPQYHNGHSHSPPAQQQYPQTQHMNGHSHSSPPQQQYSQTQPHNGQSHSPQAQQQYSQGQNSISHSPPTQEHQQHHHHQKQQYAPHPQHAQPPQHLPHQGGSTTTSVHDICSNESTELPPPPPLSPPPAKERFSYTRYQLEVLAGMYEAVRYPNAAQKRLIAKRVGITRDQVKIWFQNRRRKDVVGVPANCKTKAPDGEGDKKSMVPEHILSGVVNELLRYSDDGKAQGKKGKTIKGTPRPAPYNRPEPECPQRVPVRVGAIALADLPTTSTASGLGNTTPLTNDAIGAHVTSGHGPHATSGADPFVTSAGQHMPSGTPSHFTSANSHPNIGAPYAANGIVSGPVPHVNTDPVYSQGSSPSQHSCNHSPHSNHTSPQPALVVNGGNQNSPHSEAGVPRSNSSIHDVNSVHDDLDVSAMSDVSSVDYNADDVKSRLPRIQPDSKSNSSSVGTPSSVMSIPSSEQLDMVAPPNAVVPGAPTTPNGDMSGAESSSSDDEEPEIEKKVSISTRKSPPVHSEVPPNVTLSASDPLPDMKALPSRYPTHQGFYTQHPNLFSHQGHIGGSHQAWRASSGSPAIHAPIPSYPAGIQPSWLTDPHHPHHHPGAPLEPYLPAHKAAGADFARPGHHHQSYMGALPPGGPLGHQFPPGATLPTNSATPGLHHHPSYPHGPDLTSLAARDRVLPFPLVAEPPLRLSSMAGPPPYSSPYNASYKASPHGLRSLYPDPYQPMLISSFSNPYFGLDPAAWQPPADRSNYPNP